MNHPAREEWVAYLYGETKDASRTDLDAHLAACETCRDLVAGWRGVTRELDAWQIAPVRAPGARFMPVVRWTVAAAVLLSVGFFVGHLSRTRAIDEERLRADVAAKVETSLREQWRDELNRQVTTAVAKTQADLQQQQNDAWQACQVCLRTCAGVLQANQQTFGQFAAAVEAARQEDRQLLARMVNQLETRRLSDQGELRDDVRALGLVLGDELVRTQEQVGTLAAWVEPPLPGPTAGNRDNLKRERGMP